MFQQVCPIFKLPSITVQEKTQATCALHASWTNKTEVDTKDSTGHNFPLKYD